MASSEDLEKALEELRFFYESILAVLPGHLYWKDLDGRYLGCNQTQADFHGLSREEIIGKSEFELLSQEEAEKVAAVDDEVMKIGLPLSLEETVVIAGEVKSFLSHKVPLKNKVGDVVALLGVSVDITDRKKAEQMERTMLANAIQLQSEAEIRFAMLISASGIAHDLRTPIATIRFQNFALGGDLPVMIEGYELAQKSGLEVSKVISPSRLRKYTELPAEALEILADMDRIIDQSLASLKNSSSGEVSSEKLQLCDMEKSVQSILVRYPFEDRERDLVTHDRSYAFTFMGNSLLVIRMLNNLMKNALEQIKKNGSGAIVIRSSETSEENRLHFRDTAGGVPPEFVEKMLSGLHTTKESGTGVGLSFCVRTMESFKGEFRCETAHGEFIEFILAFPKIP